MSFRTALDTGFVFFDGSMGTLLQSFQHEAESRGDSAPKWKLPEELNLTNPDLICKIHTQYLDAGAQVILTNTFGANRCKLAEHGYETTDMIQKAVAISRKAITAYPGTYVALDIGPTGKLLEPMGTFTFDEAYNAFAEMARAGEKAGADLVVIETMSDLYELKAAVLAVKENTKLPVIASATFQENNRMLTGADSATVVATMEGLGVDAVGFNCGGDLAHARTLAEEFVRCASIPVFMEPNAGIPVVENGKTIFKTEPAEFAETITFCAKLGVRALGGCCGTTAKHISAMVRSCKKVKPLPVTAKNTTVISSWSRTLHIGTRTQNDAIPETFLGPLIIGERINPTGKKKFKEALLANDINYILSEGQSQIDAGAHILDVNVGLPGIDEGQVMLNAVRALQRTFPVPLQIDSSESDVLEKALRYYNGKALVNSVNGKKSVMEAVFPVIKKYGGVLVALTLDEEGIPSTAEGRLAIARKIIKTAEEYGIDRKNIIIDTLTLTVSSQQKEAMETIKALSLVKKELGVCTVLGVSNISFGLPQRELVNSVFFGAALQAGLDACIINPLSFQMMSVYRSYRVLSGYDTNCLEYIDVYNNMTQSPSMNTAVTTSPTTITSADKSHVVHTSDDSENLRTIIISGRRDKSRSAAEKLLETKTPVQIIDEYIVSALDEVGRDFETGRKFLPQLLLSAETVSCAFDAIKEYLVQTGTQQESKGKVVIATVYGDIHDIGKNIVKAMLENYGYTVIDLGKDVPVETVIEAVKKEKPAIVGLSALMTTTVSNMEKTIKRLREEHIPVKVMVGGAVLSPEYAQRIGADYYGKDAMASVSIVKEVCGK